MKSIHPCHIALAVAACAVIASPAYSNPRMGGGVYVPPVSVPRGGGVPINIRPPTVDVRAGIPTGTTAGTRPTVNVNTGSSGTRPSTTTTTTPGTPRGQEMTVNTYTIPGPDGNPVTLTTRSANGADLSPNGRTNQLSLENDRYTSGNFQPVVYSDGRPNDPTRTQDCAGNTIQNLYGIKDANVGAHGFYDTFVKSGIAQEVTSTTEGIDWGKVGDKAAESSTNKQVAIYYKEDGKTPGHIVTITDPANGKIVSKDGMQRVYTGTLADGDDLQKTYGGKVVIYNIDTSKGNPVLQAPPPSTNKTASSNKKN